MVTLDELLDELAGPGGVATVVGEEELHRVALDPAGGVGRRRPGLQCRQGRPDGCADNAAGLAERADEDRRAAGRRWRATAAGRARLGSALTGARRTRPGAT